MTNHLEGKVIVITGAAGGFGKLVAEMTACRGAKVVVADQNGEAAAEVAASIRTQGFDAIHMLADVTDRGQMAALARFAVESFGTLDVLVNNAGIMPLAFFADHEQAADAWDRCIDVNFKGVVNGISAVHDQMIEQGRGHIVNVSSIYGNVPVAGSGVYSATKAAVNVLSETLRAESQGKIKVTTVRPTGVPGTNLGSSIVNGAAIVGILGQNFTSYAENMGRYFNGEMPPEMTDPDNVRYWSISPEELAQQIVYAIDQPWGISISDITVRASGDQYLF
jgi:NADP-dependent 3-hydroxy acid dehydrogenase YdfG